MDSADPKSPSDGEPTRARHYEACHQRLPQVLSGEHYFAVETFYQCVESYRDARAMMIEAFDEEVAERWLSNWRQIEVMAERGEIRLVRLRANKPT